MIDVSIFMSGTRTNRWLAMYEGIKNSNNVNFEMVIVGPNIPNFSLPENFKFIHSNVKPAQCFEIAARNCTGKALLNTADDFVYTPGAIDLMFEAYLQDPPNIMSTCSYWLPGVDPEKLGKAGQNFIGRSPDEGWPFLPIAGMYDRELYHKLGGADRRFYAVMWELDIYMRLYEYGVRTVLVDGTAEEWHFESDIIPEGRRLCDRYFDQDRPIILSIWEKTADYVVRRTSPVYSYSDVGILTVNQYL